MNHLSLRKTWGKIACVAPLGTLNGHAHYPTRHYIFYSCLCYVLLGSEPI
jgi:hypothetical protein